MDFRHLDGRGGGRSRDMTTGSELGIGAVFTEAVFTPKLSVARRELRLAAAVLVEAIETFYDEGRKQDPQSRRAQHLAKQWILSTTPSTFFSFANICDLLGLDTGYVRRMVFEWKRARAHGRKRRPPLPTALVRLPVRPIAPSR